MDTVTADEKSAVMADAEIESQAPETAISIVPDEKILKKATLKVDLILLPTLGLSYLFNSLDRSNLSNSKTAGLATDLNLVGNQYNLVLTFYFITFVLFGPPIAILTKRYSAKYTIPGMMLGFGLASACTGAVKSFGSLVACRMIVGLFESGFLTSVVYYLSLWYTRQQLAKRVAIFYACSVVASAFGGLLAYGVFHITDGALYPWSYLFILEGCLTCLMGCIAFVIIPKSIQSASFLKQVQKDAIELNVRLDAAQLKHPEFNWTEALSEFRAPHFYIRAMIGISFGVILATNSNFLAIIVARLGYSTVKTNLYTVAPALSAAAFLVIYCFSSDHFYERGLHMAAVQIPSIVGYAILMVVDLTTQKGVAYFAIFLCTIGAYPMSIIFSTWTVNNIPNLNARAFTTGCLISLGNAAGLISSNIFFTDEEPRYISALIGNCVASSVCLLICLSYTLWMRYENRRRDRVFGKVEGLEIAPENSKDPNFRFSP